MRLPIDLDAETRLAECYGEGTLPLVGAVFMVKAVAPAHEMAVIAAVERERSRYHRHVAFWLRLAMGRVE